MFSAIVSEVGAQYYIDLTFVEIGLNLTVGQWSPAAFRVTIKRAYPCLRASSFLPTPTDTDVDV